jgi:Domain of unknown function (DUF6484)
MLQTVPVQNGYPLTEAILGTAHPPRIDGIVVGKLSAFDASGAPTVDFPGNILGAQSARSTVALTPADCGRDIAMMFEAGDVRKPIVLGLIHHPIPVPTEAIVDKKRIVFAAEEEIELRCGESSITLTKAGKVLIRGAYLLSRSTGVNRIKGGSVQIN